MSGALLFSCYSFATYATPYLLYGRSTYYKQRIALVFQSGEKFRKANRITIVDCLSVFDRIARTA